MFCILPAPPIERLARLSQDPSDSWDDLAGNLVASIWFALTDLAGYSLLNSLAITRRFKTFSIRLSISARIFNSLSIMSGR